MISNKRSLSYENVPGNFNWLQASKAAIKHIIWKINVFGPHLTTM